MRHPASGSRSNISIDLIAAGIYLLARLGWILVADRILDIYQSTKGAIFIALSGALVVYLKRRQRALIPPPRVGQGG